MVGPRHTSQLDEGGRIQGVPKGNAKAPSRLAIAEFGEGEGEGDGAVKDHIGRVQENQDEP